MTIGDVLERLDNLGEDIALGVCTEPCARRRLAAALRAAVGRLQGLAPGACEEAMGRVGKELWFDGGEQRGIE